jgi:hypothetical protein
MSLYCDDTSPEFYSVREPVARKEHACCECSAMIKKGETYVVCSGLWEGDFSTHKQHVLCCEACEFIRTGSECIPFGSLKEYMRDGQPRKDGENGSAIRDFMAKILRRERAEI